MANSTGQDGYKKALASNSSTGRGVTKYAWFKEIDELIGSRHDIQFVVTGTHRYIKPKQQTTSSLKNHLRTCHPEVHAVFLKRVSDATKEESARKRLTVENAGTKFRLLLNPVHQPTLKEGIDRRNEFPEDVVKRIDKAIMDMLVVDMLPFSVIEGEVFKRLDFTDPARIRRPGRAKTKQTYENEFTGVAKANKSDPKVRKTDVLL